MCTVDVSGYTVSVPDVAELCGTLAYPVTCGITPNKANNLDSINIHGSANPYPLIENFLR